MNFEDIKNDWLNIPAVKANFLKSQPVRKKYYVPVNRSREESGQLGKQTHIKKGYPKAALLSDDEVREVRMLLAKGYGSCEVADMMGVSCTIICYIKSGKTYRGVK